MRTSAHSDGEESHCSAALVEKEQVYNGGGTKSECGRKEAIEHSRSHEMAERLRVRAAKDRGEAEKSCSQVDGSSPIFVGERNPEPRRDAVEGDAHSPETYKYLSIFLDGG